MAHQAPAKRTRVRACWTTRSGNTSRCWRSRRNDRAFTFGSAGCCFAFGAGQRRRRGGSGGVERVRTGAADRPDNANAAYEIGEMQRKSGQPDKAIESFPRRWTRIPSSGRRWSASDEPGRGGKPGRRAAPPEEGHLFESSRRGCLLSARAGTSGARSGNRAAGGVAGSNGSARRRHVRAPSFRPGNRTSPSRASIRSDAR